MRTQRSLTAPYAAVQGLYWMTVCAASSFAAVYLLSLGYSNTGVGAILALGNLFGALLGPAVSARIDRGGRLTAFTAIPPMLLAVMLSVTALLLRPQRGAAATLLYILYLALVMAVNSPILKLYVDLTHGGHSVNYGVARAVGSLSYVVSAALLGVLAERAPSRMLSAAGLALAAALLLACLPLRRALPPRPAARAASSASTLGFLRANPQFCLLLLGILLVFYAHGTSSFFIQIARELGGDAGTVGWLNAYMAAIEVPVMLGIRRIRGKRSLSALLRLSFVFFSLRALGMLLAPSIPLLFAGLSFQAPGFAVYAAVVVDYIDETVPFEHSAKAQSLVFSMTTLASVLSGAVGGWLLDAAGVRAMLLAAFAVSAVGTLVALRALKSS